MARKFSFSDTSASPVRPISFIFLVVACLKGGLVNGQHYGHGVGKNTHTTSNADQALRWYLRHLPTTQDNYAPCEEDEYCTCGTLGRVVCNTSHPNGDEENFSGSGKGFGIHTVELNDLSSRPSCNLTAAQIESIMTAKLASTPQGSYDSFMDFSTGFWVSNLDPYISAFSSTNGSTADDEGDEVLSFFLEWTDDVNDREFYSLLFQVPGTIVLLELMSAKQTLITPTTPRYRSPHPR